MDIALSKLTPNAGQIPGLPGNPRALRGEKLERLKRSLRETPEMLSLRELLVVPYNGKNIVIGGNMRLRAAKALGIKSLPCKVLSEDTPVEKLRAISIKDNVSYGEWDWEALANEWDDRELDEWGLDFPAPTFGDDASADTSEPQDGRGVDETEEDGEQEELYRAMCADVLYESNNIFDIPNLLLSRQAGRLTLPFAAWGAESRQKKDVATYHFYVDDYRFEAIWRDPAKVLASGCTAIVEPNLSLFDTTPVAWGMAQIYRKRWISRYFQECGVSVYADLNVSCKFYEYNKMGIPSGYNAFCTRGYADRLEYLKAEHDMAKEISGNDTPNLIVYGGGKAVREYCAAHSLVYVEQLMTAKKNNM